MLVSKLIIAVTILCSFSFNQILAQNTYQYMKPVQRHDGWKTKSIYDLEVDTTRIHAFFSQMKNQRNKLHSALLVKDGDLIVEEYLNGELVDRPHKLRSVTKSIRSLLLGIAIEQGIIRSLDDPILKYLTNYSLQKNLDPRKNKITIRHLITMSTGLDCNDWDKKSKGQEDRVYKQKDWIQYTLDLPLVHEPGQVSYYCSMGSVLLAEIISQASGMSIQNFADIYLFQPLDITNIDWVHTANKNVIPAAMRLKMTSRDLAKIGLLVLNRGKWKDTQVISEQWINESTSTHKYIGSMRYGYLWWNISFRVGDKVYDSVVATGNGGQYIMIVPEQNMVGVFTGGAYNSEEDKLPFGIMRDVLLATFIQ